MTKDYKHQLNKKRQEKGVPGFIWMLCGLGIGLMVAGLVYLRSGMPTGEAVPTENVSAEEPVVAEEEQQQTTKKAVPRPRFEFYTILRDMEVVVPDHKISGPTHHGVRQVEEEGTYVLQVGSFRSDEQADRLKARLVLLGLDVSIKPVDMGQNGRWYRVLAGPYRDLEKLNKSRMQLQQQNITTLLLKVKAE